MKSFPALIAAALAVSFTSHASAAVMLQWQPVDNTDALDGYVTQDLIVTTDAPWRSAQLLLELDAGSVYHHPDGNGVHPPNPNFFSVVPTLEFDTYLAAGDPETAASVSGGAVDLGGDATLAWEEQLLNVNWFIDGADLTGDLFLGRFTLSEEASGTWSVRIGTADDAVIHNDQPVIGGTLVPEPASAALLAAGTLTLLSRRRSPASAARHTPST